MTLRHILTGDTSSTPLVDQVLELLRTSGATVVVLDVGDAHDEARATTPDGSCEPRQGIAADSI